MDSISCGSSTTQIRLWSLSSSLQISHKSLSLYAKQREHNFTSSFILLLGSSGVNVICLIVVIIMIATATLMFIFAPNLMGLFIDDAEVIALGALVLRIQAFGEIGLAVANISSGIFKGAGDTKWPFYIAAIGMWIVRIIPAIILINIFDF